MLYKYVRRHYCAYTLYFLLSNVVSLDKIWLVVYHAAGVVTTLIKLGFDSMAHLHMTSKFG